jgi:hypothetical protein
LKLLRTHSDSHTTSAYRGSLIPLVENVAAEKNIATYKIAKINYSSINNNGIFYIIVDVHSENTCWVATCAKRHCYMNVYIEHPTVMGICLNNTPVRCVCLFWIQKGVQRVQPNVLEYIDLKKKKIQEMQL